MESLTAIDIGTVFKFHLDNVNAADTTEPVLIEQFVDMPIDWTLQWYSASQELELTSTSYMEPGVYDFSVGSVALIMDNRIVYGNDSSFTYTVQDSAVELNGGNPEQVTANGLLSSSLSLLNPNVGEATDLIIEFAAASVLDTNDRILVLLPVFTGPSGTQQHLDLSGPDAGLISAYWNSVDNTINIRINYDGVTSVNVTVLAISGLIQPSTGSNAANGLPKIALRWHNNYFFNFTEFQHFTPVLVVATSSVTYLKPAISGEAKRPHQK